MRLLDSTATSHQTHHPENTGYRQRAHFDRSKVLTPQHPEWKTLEPFAFVLKGDVKAARAGGEHALLEMAMGTHAGMTTGEFEKIATDWIAAAKHPKTGRLFTEMVYQPMLEGLAYSRGS